MAFNVNQFRSTLVNDGARPSLFEVVMSLPPILGAAPLTNDIIFRVKATSLPGDGVSQIEVPYFGRVIKIAGTRSFPDWSFQVINDENFTIRNNLEIWLSQINSHVGNIRNPAARSGVQYQAQAYVTQYAKTGEIIKQYMIYGAFPVDVAAIDLDWDATDRIEEFRVTFLYDFWDVSGGVTGNAGGN